jgi:hypothetical protein
MMSSGKMWQARIVSGENFISAKLSYTYGASLEHLLFMASTRLKVTKPLYFTNGGDSIAGIYRYFYVDETKAHLDFLKPEHRNLEEGWWYDHQDMAPGNQVQADRRDGPVRLESFYAAVEHVNVKGK